MLTRVAGFHREGNLSIVQLAASNQDSFQYTTCSNAIRSNLLEVKELNGAGSVNAIVVLNDSDQFIFMMDGDILAGAKQNRVVNVSLLLAPTSKTNIPVSCVERGRWHHVSSKFTGTGYAAPASLRAEKARQVKESLKRKRGFCADQGEVWASVSRFGLAHEVRSDTANLSDIFDEKETEFEKLIGQFAPHESANGLAVFFGKSLASIDLLNRRDVYREYFPKLLRGAAFEASTMLRKEETLSEAEAGYRTLEMLDGFEKVAREEHPSVAVGVDRRFESGEMTGFELVYGGHLIHLAALKGQNPLKMA
jgi:ARG and Rhodanese-Phosphatase-superfamily-associated Protein domain